MKRELYGKMFEMTDLREQGIRDLVFDLIPAIEFMFLAIKHGEKILGGDIVIKDSNNQYCISFDNWYSKSDSPEESFVEALDFLELIMKNKKNADWKVIVVTTHYSNFML